MDKKFIFLFMLNMSKFKLNQINQEGFIDMVKSFFIPKTYITTPNIPDSYRLYLYKHRAN